MDPKHRELVDGLQEAYEEISRRYHEDDDRRSLTVFLAQSIYMHADEGTLERMLDDARKHIQTLDANPGM